VLSGNASIDEAMLTGESMPVEKAKYDKVIGGTIVQHGNIRMIATKVGSNTVLAQIIELMKKAQAAKPPVQKLGDKGGFHICSGSDIHRTHNFRHYLLCCSYRTANRADECDCSIGNFMPLRNGLSHAYRCNGRAWPRRKKRDTNKGRRYD